MAPEERSEPPLGTVTFVLADVEPEAALARPERVIDAALATHHGARLDRLGRGAGAVAVFESAADAVAAAHQIQRALTGDANTVLAGPRLRLGIHTGEVEAREHHACGGPALHRGARLRYIPGTSASAHWLPSPEVRPTGGVEHVVALARSGGHGPKYCSVGSALDRIR